MCQLVQNLKEHDKTAGPGSFEWALKSSAGLLGSNPGWRPPISTTPTFLFNNTFIISKLLVIPLPLQDIPHVSISLLINIHSLCKLPFIINFSDYVDQFWMWTSFLNPKLGIDFFFSYPHPIPSFLEVKKRKEKKKQYNTSVKINLSCVILIYCLTQDTFPSPSPSGLTKLLRDPIAIMRRFGFMF